MKAHRKVILFLGPPGSGKGTQAERLSLALGVPAISTGEMLRRECQSGSNLGKAVQNVLAAGQLVSDELINQVVVSRFGQYDCEGGCILDGYPRTVAQARFLDRLLGSLGLGGPVVFDFDVNGDAVIARLTRRRQCAECGRTFTVSASDKAGEFFCDRDGAKLVQRADDNPATIRDRLKLYELNAGELRGYYASRDYYRICAAGTPDQVATEVLRTFEGMSHPVMQPRPQAPLRAQYQAQTA